MRRDPFQAIADPTRRAILALIALQAMTPNALAEHFDTTRQAVSNHIKILAECQLVKQSQSGREIYYHFNPNKMKEIADWLEPFRNSWEEKFTRLDDVLINLKKIKMASNSKTQIIAEAGKQELFIIREFDAPRDLVFKAYSEEDILLQWVGPREMKMRFEKFEPKPGGSYRYLQSLPNGMEFGFNGVCHEHTAPLRIIQTFEFEGLPEKGHVVLETTRFEELPEDRTRVTVQSVFQSVTDRDGMVQSGMERGVVDSHERLDELISNNLLK